jgi:Asp-tRNA(Asn)/Glu-tRNA(Gln) amidotransferase A subunit family amidase
MRESSDEFGYVQAQALRRAFKKRTLSPVEVAQALLARIDRIDSHLNAFCWRDDRQALAAARASERRWLMGEPLSGLDGIPTVIKDTFATKSMPTIRGSWNAPSQPDHNSPVVDLMMRGGLVPLGKTTTPELGWKAVTDSPRQGVTRNPLSLGRTPGGSSGGSATALAAGLCTVAPGSDGAGSIRIPASFCGLVGFKPTFGRVPFYPDSAFADLAHAGPMGRSVADVRELFRILDAPDNRDPTSLFPRRRMRRSRLLSHRRLAVLEHDADFLPRPDVGACFGKAVAVISGAVAGIEAVPFSGSGVRSLFMTIYAAGAAFATAAWDQAQWRRADPGLAELSRLGASVTRTEFQEAARARRALAVSLGRILDRFDALILPTTPITAFEAGHDVPSGTSARFWLDWAPYTYPFNATGHPACSIPIGHGEDGMPVGLQVVGRHHADDDLLDLCEDLEAVAGSRGRRWPLDIALLSPPTS